MKTLAAIHCRNLAHLIKAFTADLDPKGKATCWKNFADPLDESYTER
jgi:hypothetical protein